MEGGGRFSCSGGGTDKETVLRPLMYPNGPAPKIMGIIAIVYLGGIGSC